MNYVITLPISTKLYITILMLIAVLGSGFYGMQMVVWTSYYLDGSSLLKSKFHFTSYQIYGGD